jgi:hypothetical protein
LAQLIRSLHEKWSAHSDRGIYEQIRNLRARLQLIRWMQICGATSFIFAASSMTLLFFKFDDLGHLFFGASLLCLIASVGFLLRENIISVRALELQLGSVGSTGLPSKSQAVGDGRPPPAEFGS